MADKVKNSPYWKGVFSYNMHDANGVRKSRLLNIVMNGPV